MDHLHDTNNIQLNEISLPGFVKVAEENPRFFAYTDGIESFFPIDTPSNTWLSAFYFEKNASEHLNVDDYINTHNNILDALKMFNVEYNSHNKNIEKNADDYYTFEKFASEVRVFEQNYKHIKPEERHEKAKELLSRYQALKDSGAEVSGSLPKIVDEYAGSELRKDWPDVVKYRATRVNDTVGKEAYNELSNINESKEIILKLLSMLDSKFGLDNYYDHGIKDPYRALLTREKEPEKKVVIMIVNGKEYDHEKLASFDPNKLSDKFGDEIINSLKNNRNEYLQTAPNFVKIAIAEMIDSND